MKKNKHITINLNNEDYEQLKRQAEQERRTLATLTALIIEDYIKGNN